MKEATYVNLERDRWEFVLQHSTKQWTPNVSAPQGTASVNVAWGAQLQCCQEVSPQKT